MWKTMTTVAVLSVVALVVAACGVTSPDSVTAGQGSRAASPTATLTATPVTGASLCSPAQLTTVYRQDQGVLGGGKLGFVYTVRNTGSTACGLSNAATLSGHQEATTSPLPPGTPPTTLTLAAPTATAMPVRILPQTPSVLSLAPEAEATLAMVAPGSCIGSNAAGHAYAEIVLTVPGIGPIILKPGVAFVDCGTGSLSVQPWNPGPAPDLYVPPAT